MGDGTPASDEAGKEPIREYNPQIRSKDITEGIDTLLDIFSFKTGLGHSYYKFSNGSVQKTATEVISQNSDLYRNICKMQLCIEKNIYEIVKALLYVSNYIFGTSYNLDCKMSVTFDASLIEDKTAERERALKEVSLNLLTPDEYRAMYYPELGNKKVVDLQKDI
jgi:A118 family predicted phage portal protein